MVLNYFQQLWTFVLQGEHEYWLEKFWFRESWSFSIWILSLSQSFCKAGFIRSTEIVRRFSTLFYTKWQPSVDFKPAISSRRECVHENERVSRVTWKDDATLGYLLGRRTGPPTGNSTFFFIGYLAGRCSRGADRFALITNRNHSYRGPRDTNDIRAIYFQWSVIKWMHGKESRVRSFHDTRVN